MLTFAWAWVFWLVPLPLLVWWLAPPRRRMRSAVLVPFLKRITAAGGVTRQAAVRRDATGWIARIVVWLLMLSALARPQWLEPPVERIVPTRDLLLLVDLSTSMDERDFTTASGQPIDRLSAVKDVVGEFLVRREGDRVGLVVFGNSPFLQVPFTTDLELSRRLLDETEVGMAGPRTALGDAIGLAIQLFDNSDVPERTVIALTDGNDNASAVPPTEAARVARDRDITIHTIAMGDPTTVGEEKIDEAALQSVARTTGGESFLALNRSELEGVYSTLDQIETREIQTVSHRPRIDLYFWPLGGAFLLSLTVAVWTPMRQLRLQNRVVEPTRLRVNSRTFELELTEPSADRQAN